MEEYGLVYPYPRPYMCSHPPLQLNQDPLLRDSTVPPITMEKAYQILDFQMFMLQNPHLITDLEWRELNSLSQRMEERIRLNESKAWQFIKNVKKRATEAGKAAYQKASSATARARQYMRRTPAPAQPQATPSLPPNILDPDHIPPRSSMIPLPEHAETAPQEYGPSPMPEGYAPQPMPQDVYQPQPQPYNQPSHQPRVIDIPDEGIMLVPLHHHHQAMYPPPPPQGAVQGMASPFLTVFHHHGRR